MGSAFREEFASYLIPSCQSDQIVRSKDGLNLKVQTMTMSESGRQNNKSSINELVVFGKKCKALLVFLKVLKFV